ncbi:uncharacterized protein TM35_000192780 [Trypanosoma theileri]|uniref:Uncharacterized protein n=1 Tax=Trypanosoma theileri TaxID=67003 RepID=A0A1X0NTJ8_9TRYP|nr:uncharacterized protein TM35_000192780 [Trypanosoma theileri]ORC88034.1 hypothetical protein TM35_000192780 [Trypanosoma theileri]
MDDWEKEYEEDRRRLALGQDIVLNGRRGDLDVNPFEEKPPVASTVQMALEHATTAVVAEGAKKTSSLTDLSPVMFKPTVMPEEIRGPDTIVRRDDQAEVADIYAHYNSNNNNNNGDDFYSRREGIFHDGDTEVHERSLLKDDRFDLPCLSSGWSLHSLFKTKIGRRIFFAEVVNTTFKGFISGKEALVGCFVTPNCLYIGDVETGALIICIDIMRLFEVFVFNDVAIGLRTMDALDLHLQTLQHTQQLVDILQKIATYWKAKMHVIRSTAEREKTFKKEMRLIDKKSYTWTLAEDPRTGLRIVHVTGPFLTPLAPVAAKILHWFGNVQQPSKDWKGSKVRQRRCAWITATCFFVSKAEGPGVDGRGIRHCVAVEYMTELFVGPGGELGVAALRGPLQPTVFVVFDSEAERNAVVFLLQECYHYRHAGGGSIRVTPVESVERKIRDEKKISDWRPQLFLMRPQKELYEFLRGPSVKK